MRGTLTLILFLTAALAAGARVRYDTTYIRRPEGRWLIRTRTDVGGGATSIMTASAENSYQLDLAGDTKIRQHFGFGYKNLILGIGINISGKKVGWDTALRALGNRFGLEVLLSGNHIHGGKFSVNGEGMPLEPGAYRQTSLNGRFYHAFNGRKFSMPAVLTQGFRQHRSAGSAMLTLATSMLWLTRKLGDDEQLPLYRHYCGFAGLGGGYGYNWVPFPKWLLHLSLTENVGVPWGRSTLKRQKINTPILGPGFLTAGRAAVFFYPGKWYFGLSAMAEHYIVPDMGSPYAVGSLDVRGQLSVGVRF